MRLWSGLCLGLRWGSSRRMVSRNTTLVPSLGLHIGPACEAGRPKHWHAKEHVLPQKRKSVLFYLPNASMAGYFAAISLSGSAAS